MDLAVTLKWDPVYDSLIQEKEKREGAEEDRNLEDYRLDTRHSADLSFRREVFLKIRKDIL